MGYKIRLSTVLVVCITTSFAVTCLVSILPMSSVIFFSDNCACDKAETPVPETKTLKKLLATANERPHRLAIIVPFRDRFEELLQFAPHMSKFLKNQDVNHEIFVINQVDPYRFNRAALINVGFLYTKQDFDYIAMHDVDLLPMNPELHYNYPENGPFHVASPKLHPRYHYANFVGGILLVKREHFEIVDGMSNKYWGWGLEDDEFFVRLKEAKLNVTRPDNVQTDTTNTFRHIHDRAHRKRDTAKCFNQREVTRKRDRETGLHNVVYEIVAKHSLQIDDVPVTVVNVKLVCDKKSTPWCDCSERTDNSLGKLPPKENAL